MQSSNPFENSSGSNNNEEEIIKNEDPTIQSTLIKRIDIAQHKDHLKKVSDTKSNEGGSICGASPFEVTKEDHSNLKSASTLNQQKKSTTTSTANASISLPFSNNESAVSLEKQTPTTTSTLPPPPIQTNNNNNDSNQFVSVPFSPPLKPFSLEKQESNSELPYMRPDNFESTNYPHSTTTTNIMNPGIDRTYYNMNSRMGSNIPLDDDNADSRVHTTTTLLNNTNQEEAVIEGGDENGPMVNININPGTFAEPNGAEVPVVTRRRRKDDRMGVIVMCAVILIIVGGCVAFLFL